MVVLTKSFLTRLFLAPVALIVFIAAILLIGTVRIKHPQYMLWLLSRKPCPVEYIHKYIYYDYRRDSIVKGKKEEEILKIFPYAISGDNYSIDTYRGGVLNFLRNAKEYEGKKVKLFWLEEGVFGFVVVTVNGQGKEIRLVKG